MLLRLKRLAQEVYLLQEVAQLVEACLELNYHLKEDCLSLRQPRQLLILRLDNLLQVQILDKLRNKNLLSAKLKFNRHRAQNLKCLVSNLPKDQVSVSKLQQLNPNHYSGGSKLPIISSGSNQLLILDLHR